MPSRGNRTAFLPLGLLMCGGFLCSSAAAQNDARLPVGATELISEVRRDINRYRWTFGGATTQRSGKWQIAADNQFTSDAFVLFDERLSFRDEYRLRAVGIRPVRNSSELRLSTATDWYSLSRVLSAQTWVGVRLKPTADLFIEPRVGAAVDRRPGASSSGEEPQLRADFGPAAGWFASWRPSSERYSVVVESVADARRIAPRRDYALAVRGTSSGLFEKTRWSMEGVLSSFRRDTYESASFLNRDAQQNLLAEAIEQTISDTLALSGRINTPIVRTLRFVSSGDVMFNRRRVRAGSQPDETVFFETDFDRRAVELDAAAVFERGQTQVQTGLVVGAESEARTLANRSDLSPVQAAQKAELLQQADSDRGFFGLAASARTRLASVATITADGSARLTRHDTPEVNPDDRDERSIIGRLAIRTHLTRHLNVDARLFASQYETVYLKSERSAENNTQTALRLQTAVDWRPSPDTHVRIGPEVRATYTVDTFPLEGRPPRDQSARELRYDVEASHVVADGIRVLANGTRSDLRLGRFIESTFSEIPFDTLRATSGQLRVQVGKRHTAEIGVRVFVRSDFNLGTRVTHRRRLPDGTLITDGTGKPVLFTTTRPGRDIVRQLGPVAALSWNLRGASVLRIDGWLTFQKQYQQLFGDLPAADAAEIRRAAERGTSRLIPNVAMTVLWRM